MVWSTDTNLGRLLYILGLFHLVLSNAPPTFHGDWSGVLSQNENASIGTIIKTFSVSDPDGDDMYLSAVDADTQEFFNITPSKGQRNFTASIVIAKALDCDPPRQSLIAVRVRVTDRENSEGNTVDTKSHFQIVDVNDEIPKFTSAQFSWTIDENTGSIDDFLVTAADNDQTTRFYSMQFTLNPNTQSSAVANDYKNTFHIFTDQSNRTAVARVRLQKPLDFETNTYYSFKITATDNSGSGNSVSNDFVVRVQDVQDTAPVFTSALYRTSVSENIALGANVLKVTAMDGDRGVPNPVNYAIENGTCSELFRIDENGQIVTNKAIDRDRGGIAELGSTCILNIVAFEVFDRQSQPNNTNTNTTAEARITISDVNDEAPTFERMSYEAEVFENTAQNIPITLLNVTGIDAYDLDEGDNAQMTFTLHYENGTECKDFDVTPHRVQGRGSLIIRVKNSGFLDYEAKKEVNIIIKATEAANTNHSANASVNIRILDINDHNPQFGNKTYLFNVLENSPNASSVGNITANDADSEPYANVTFSLTGGAERFTIDAKIGEIRTACSNDCSKEFDRERQQSFYMTVTASDGAGRSNSTSVQVDLIDVNDEAPRFRQTRYFVYAKEMDTNKYKVMPLVVVQADDADDTNTNNSKIGFCLDDTSPMPSDNITINETTGEVFLKYEIDYEKLNETNGVVDVIVTAYDFGQPQRSTNVTVTITVEDGNDNAPVFNSYLFNGTVSENATSSPTIFTIAGIVHATDEDGTARNNECQYFIYSGAFDHFSVNSSSGEVYVKPGANLDRETRDLYNITIIAIDTGSPPLTGTTMVQVKIKDVNDKSPTFSGKLEIKIDENKTDYVSESFIQINATDEDENKELVYSFIGWKGFDKNNKEISGYDTEKIKTYFKINETDGKVYVSSKDTLPDREVAQVIQVTVNVSDKNAYHPVPQTATATLTITLQDVNDNAPNFPNGTVTNVSMRENAGHGSILTTVQAYDFDETSNITYSIIKGASPIDAFEIPVDAKGEIRKKGDLDRETNSSIILTINVTDNGNPPLWSTLDITVNILDVNDNTPVFDKAIYTVTILENTTDGFQIFHVNASDKDDGQNGNVSFTLDVGNDNSFEIDPITGIISVKNNTWIDRERRETYMIQIIAKDNPIDIIEQRSASQALEINILDVNDNAPEFTNGGKYYVKAREDLDNGSFLMKVSATDKDKAGTPNGNISYTIENPEIGLFKIDSKTGDILTNQSLQNHYGNVTLKIKAEDSGEPKLSGHATVVIFIDDVNLNKPIITGLPVNHTIGVYECTPVNIVVYTFNYTDADKGYNAKAKFNMSVVEGSPNVFEYFRMTSDGILLLTESISNIGVVPFEFYIQATDEGTPPLSSDKLRIKIQVKDVNDHPPSFANDKIELDIEENKAAWSSVGQLTSIDPDRDASACYYIYEQPTMGLFVVGENNGTVHATKMFDYETQKNFTIKVSVKDCSTTVNASVACNESVQAPESVLSTQTVTIGVKDVNDNPPVFTTNEITFGMRRTTAVNTILDLTLKDYVSDNDTQKYATKDTWLFNNTGSIKYSDSLKSEPTIGHGNCADGQQHVICVHGNGSVVNNKYFSEDRSGYIIVPVEVHDTNNRSITQIRIYLIGDSEIMKMVVFGNKTIVSDRKDDIMGLYSKITDHTFVYDWLEDHKDSNGRVDSFRTDLYFHVVNKDGRILSADEALRLVDRFSYELMQAQSQYSISEVTKWISTEDDGESPLKTVYILVALVVVLTLTIAIIIYVSIVTRNTYKRKLQAATINTHEFKDGKVGNEFIPGSNQYSRQSNPLLNATISEKAVYDNISMESDNSFDADIVGNGGMAPKYDGLEEQVRVLDMYTEVAPGMGDVESPLEAALRLHDMQNLHDKPETISTEGIVSTHDIDALIFSNPSYLKGLESSEI